jgi:hypothetical protein
MTLAKHQREIEEQVEAVADQLLKHIRDKKRLAVVQAPPGSGKTHLLLRAVGEAFKRKQRVAVATQTRSQADDICKRLAEGSKLPGVRFVARNGVAPNVPKGIDVIGDQNRLPDKPCIVIATTAKWGTIELRKPFDVVFVEEAWQLKWADFMLLGQVAPRFVLIGDPGQIPPVVSIDASRWETAPRGPHRPAPELILQEGLPDILNRSLPATRRLPYCTADLIRPFYDFKFGTWAQPDERKLKLGRRGRGPLSEAMALLERGSVVGVSLPTPDGGPPLECDEQVAHLAVQAVSALLESQPEYEFEGKRRPLQPADVGLCATHHVMNAAMDLCLSRKLRDVAIDTPERLQGLQRRVMVIVHPLSGVVQPSEFDLETGRLCVMASRHQISLIVVSRDHLSETLEAHLPVASQAIGRPDVAGRGHHQNLMFWNTLRDQNRIVGLRSA